MRKDIIYKGLGLLTLAAVLAFSNPVSSSAMTEKELSELTDKERESYELTKKYQKTLPKVDPRVNIDKKYFKKRKDSGTKKGIHYPSKYTLKDNKFVSSIKDQDITGTCWAFSFMEAAQDSVYSKDHDLTDAPDFSEYDLAYFMYNQPVDRLGLTKGDKTTSYEKPGTKAYYAIGGNVFPAMIAAAKGIGCSSEKDAKFTDLIDNLHTSGLATLPDSYCYVNDIYTLSGAEFYDITDESVRDDIKYKIMEHGAGQVAYVSYTDSYDFHTNSYCSSEESNPMSGGGHAVAIVGWDDDYSVNNFKYEPEGKGAWLVKNSWGDTWGMDGYFWMSYYEPTLDAISFYDFDSKDSYDNIYQYDGTAAYKSRRGYKTQANIFTAQRNEIINAVSFFTLSDDTDYSVKIYKNPDPDNPSSGELMVTLEGNVGALGYTKVNLGDKKFSVSAGDDDTEADTFSVVVTQTVDGAPADILVDADMSYGYMDCDSVSNAGESFLSKKDVEESGNIAAADWEDISSGGSANVRVKVFTTVEEGEIPSEGYNIPKTDKKLYEVEVGKSVKAEAGIGKSKDSEAFINVSKSKNAHFSVKDESIAFVDDLGNIYGKKVGETKLVLKLKINGVMNISEVATVKVVTPSDIDTISIDKDEDYATENNPIEIGVGSHIIPEYTVSPQTYKDSVYFDVEKVDGEEPEDAEFYEYDDVNGLVFYDEGTYRVTATIDDQDYLQGDSEEFYVHAYYDVVDCGDDFSKIKANPYDDDVTKIYRYTAPEYAATNLTFNYDIETDADYLYVIGTDDENTTAKEILGFIRDQSTYYEEGGEDLFMAECLSGMADGQKVRVPRKYVFMVLCSDGAHNGSFEVTDVSESMEIETISMDEGDMEVDITSGVETRLQLYLDPEDAYDGFLKVYGDDENIVNTDYDMETNEVIITANKVGTTYVWVYTKDDFEGDTQYKKDAVDGRVTGQSLGIKVNVIASEELPETFEFKDNPMQIDRSSAVKPEFNSNAWNDCTITYESADPKVATVDLDGNIVGVSCGEAKVKATVSIAREDEGGEFYYDTEEAETTVKVVEPDKTDVNNMQSVHPYVSGMEETYTYNAAEGTECMNLYFDSRTAVYYGDNITIQDKNGNYYGYDYDSGRVVITQNEDDVVYGGQYDITDALSYNPLTVYGDTVKVHFVTQEREESEDDWDSGYDDEDEGQYGFRIKRIQEGKKTNYIQSAADLYLDFESYNSNRKKISIIRDPEDAIDIMYYSIDDSVIAEVDGQGVVTALKNGDTGYSVFIPRPRGGDFEFGGKVYVGDKPLKGVKFYSRTPDGIRGDEYVDDINTIDIPLGTQNFSILCVKNPWNSPEEIEAVVEDGDLEVYSGYDEDGELIYIDPVKKGSFKVEVKANIQNDQGEKEYQLLKTFNVNVTDREPIEPEEYFNTFDKEYFETDLNDGKNPEDITADDIAADVSEGSIRGYWTYKKPGADYVEVSFDKDGNLPINEARIFIYTLDGQLVGVYTGNSENVNEVNKFAGKTIKVEGEGFILAYEQNYYDFDPDFYMGFKVTDINAHVPEIQPDPVKPSEDDSAVKVGTVVKYGKAKYKVLSGNTVRFMAPVAKNPKSFTVPATIKVKGKSFKVTEIAPKAFKNKKKLKKVVIGKNVRKIGASAFYGCKSLKTVTIKSGVLKSVGKNAIKGINKKAVIKTPKKKRKAYKKLFKAKTGYKKTMKIK